MDDDKLKEEMALVYLDRGNKMYRKQELGEALRLYKQSIATHPTADAYTAVAHVYNIMGQQDEAIKMCHRAIALDPDSGAPYNELGVYLMELEKWQEAIPWLEKAIQSRRYSEPQQPHVNLGRAYAKLGDWQSAMAYYDQAHSIAPLYLPATWEKYALLGRLN